MTVDRTKLAFYSGDPIDKIVQSDIVSYTLASGTPTDFLVPQNVLKSVLNTFGAKSLVIASWSLDATNFISSLQSLYYYNSSLAEPIIKASVSVGCDNTNIYFWLLNNYTSSLTFTIKYSVYTIS